jgi:hypothetical protein
MEEEFKVLMYGSIFVDINLLNKGIYRTRNPFLYDKDMTLEDLKNRAINMKDLSRGAFYEDPFLKNLMQCELVKVILTIEI